MDRKQRLINCIMKQKLLDTNRYAITFGEVAILHTGGDEQGSGIRDHGFSVNELENIRDKINSMGGNAILYNLSDNLPTKYHIYKPTTAKKNDPPDNNEAATLIIKNGADFILNNPHASDILFKEQMQKVDYDKRYWDNRRGETLNKQARFNVVFGNKNQTASDDYKKYTIKAFRDLPYLNQIRKKLPSILGEKAYKLNAEGNHYYKKDSGIGFHGDAERKIVIALSLGKPSILRYQWRLPGSSTHILKPIDIISEHGDIYIMSEKATGYDWKKRSKVRVVHAAGAEKYINK